MLKNKTSNSILNYPSYIIIGFTLTSILAVFFLQPISQDASYHGFVDNRSMWGIPNFLNVVSNLPFIIIGAAGVISLFKSDRNAGFKAANLLFFIGVILIGLGSGYYHLWPTNDTLLFDRLPMTIAFMSFLSVIIYHLINPRLGRILLFPLVAVGIASALYWYLGEKAGQGDLRFYGLVQFYPMLAIPLMVLLYPTPPSLKKNLLWVVIFYGSAKIFERFDEEIFTLTNIVSGHTLKHLAAAGAILKILVAIQIRTNK